MSSPSRFSQENKNSPDRFLCVSEFLVAFLLSAGAVASHIFYFVNAGPLWRDEVNSLRMATMPHLADLWHSLARDSFPIFSFLVQRIWMAADWTVTDTRVRAFGLLIGIGLLASLWIVSYQIKNRPPVLSLAAFALFPLTIQVGDSLRAYGLGMILAILSFGSIWRLAEKPCAKRMIFALCLSVLASQCIYQNIVFAAAAGIGVFGITVVDKNWRRLKFLALALAPVPLLLLPYRASIRAQHIAMGLEDKPFSAIWIRSSLMDTLRAPHPATLWLWIIFFTGGIAAALWTLRQKNYREPGNGINLFCLVTILTACAGYVLYLKTANTYIYPRYFLPILGFVAVALEAFYGRHFRMRILALALAASFLAVNAPALWQTIHTRQTNMDRVVDYLNRHASPNDIVILSHWYYGVGFSRYYSGTAEWNTMPPLEDKTIHRYDLFRKAMATDDPVKPLLEQMELSLNKKGNIWIIGGLPEMDGNTAPVPIPPAPHPETGWRKTPYLRNWGQRVRFLMQSHGLRPEKIPLPEEPVNDLEAMTLDLWKPADKRF